MNIASAGAVVMFGFAVVPSHSQEREFQQTEQLGLGVLRSESDAHYPNELWLDPPSEYADKASNVRADADAISHGKYIWDVHCLSCHGKDGKGTGPTAESLSQLPAGLSNSFHNALGIGDASLYWRVSEGGTVEPFQSLGSEMPAFKDELDESERWDVLAYVYAFFHQGLIHWTLQENSGQ